MKQSPRKCHVLGCISLALSRFRSFVLRLISVEFSNFIAFSLPEVQKIDLAGNGSSTSSGDEDEKRIRSGRHARRNERSSNQTPSSNVAVEFERNLDGIELTNASERRKKQIKVIYPLWYMASMNKMLCKTWQL